MQGAAGYLPLLTNITWPLSNGSTCSTAECECARLEEIVQSALTKQLSNVHLLLETRIKSDFSLKVGRQPIILAERQRQQLEVRFIWGSPLQNEQA
jgi:hypothetical protein